MEASIEVKLARQKEYAIQEIGNFYAECKEMSIRETHHDNYLRYYEVTFTIRGMDFTLNELVARAFNWHHNKTYGVGIPAKRGYGVCQIMEMISGLAKKKGRGG